MKNCSKRLLFLLTLMVSTMGFSQDTTFCSTTFFGDDKHHLIKDERRGDSVVCVYKFNVNLHFLRDDNSYNSLAETYNNTQIISHISEVLNTYFNPFGIHFVVNNNMQYLTGDIYVHPEELYGAGNNPEFLSLLLETQSNENVIDIYLGDDNHDYSGGYSNHINPLTENYGFYLAGTDYVTGYPVSMSNALFHEMGHLFGLYHVYHNTNEFFTLSSHPSIDFGQVVCLECGSQYIDQLVSGVEDLNNQDVYEEECTQKGDKVCDTNPQPKVQPNSVDLDHNWITYDLTNNFRIVQYQPFETLEDFSFSEESSYNVFQVQTTNIMNSLTPYHLLEFTDGQGLRMRDHIILSL